MGFRIVVARWFWVCVVCGFGFGFRLGFTAALFWGLVTVCFCIGVW